MCIPVWGVEKDGSIRWTNGWTTKRFRSLEHFRYWEETGSEDFPGWEAIARRLRSELDDALGRVAELEYDIESAKLDLAYEAGKELPERWRRICDAYQVRAPKFDPETTEILR